MAQTVFPYLLYEDVGAMLDWLSSAFGFTEKLRFTGDDGTVNHAEMDVGGASIMMGDPGDEYRSPKDGGAQIRQELADTPYGDRRYDAHDPEGHLWMFSTHVRDVSPEDWGATA